MAGWYLAHLQVEVDCGLLQEGADDVVPPLPFHLHSGRTCTGIMHARPPAQVYMVLPVPVSGLVLDVCIPPSRVLWPDCTSRGVV